MTVTTKFQNYDTKKQNKSFFASTVAFIRGKKIFFVVTGVILLLAAAFVSGYFVGQKTLLAKQYTEATTSTGKIVTSTKILSAKVNSFSDNVLIATTSVGNQTTFLANDKTQLIDFKGKNITATEIKPGMTVTLYYAVTDDNKNILSRVRVR